MASDFLSATLIVAVHGSIPTAGLHKLETFGTGSRNDGWVQIYSRLLGCTQIVNEK